MKNLAIVLILILCYSCSSKENKKNASETISVIKSTAEKLKIKIDEKSLNDKIKLSEICDSLWYVTLESTKESMIGEMDKVIINDNLIIIADFNISKEIFIFDIKGKFINKISKLGKGPFEYSNVEDFCYWPPTKSIFLLDRDAKKIIEYTISGKPLREILITFDAVNIALLDHDTFVLYVGFRENNDLKYNLLYVNSKGEIIKKAFPIDDRILIKSSKNDQFYYFNNELYFNTDYDNNVYRLNNNSISYKYSLDFIGKNIPDELIFNKESEELYEDISKNKYACSNLQFESDKFFFARIVNGHRDHLQYIYSKKDKQSLLFCSTINDIPNSFINPFFIGNVGDVFYSIVDSELLLLVKNALIAKKNTLPKNNKLIDMILNYQETDNPILAFYRIKFPKNTK